MKISFSVEVTRGYQSACTKRNNYKEVKLEPPIGEEKKQFKLLLNDIAHIKTMLTQLLIHWNEKNQNK